MLHLHVLNSLTRLYELEPEMIQQSHVNVLTPLCMEKHGSKSLELQTHKVMEVLANKYGNVSDLMTGMMKHI